MKLPNLLLKIIVIGVIILCVLLAIFIGKNYRYIVGTPSTTSSQTSPTIPVSLPEQKASLLIYSDPETRVSFSYNSNLAVTKTPSYKPRQISPPAQANPTIVFAFKTMNASLQKQTVSPSFEIRYSKEAKTRDPALQIVRMILQPLSSEAATSFKNNKSSLPEISSQNSMLLSESEQTKYHIIPILYHEKNSTRPDAEEGYLITRGDENVVLFIYYLSPLAIIKQDLVTIIESMQ